MTAPPADLWARVLAHDGLVKTFLARRYAWVAARADLWDDALNTARLVVRRALETYDPSFERVTEGGWVYRVLSAQFIFRFRESVQPILSVEGLDLASLPDRCAADVGRSTRLPAAPFRRAVGLAVRMRRMRELPAARRCRALAALFAHAWGRHGSRRANRRFATAGGSLSALARIERVWRVRIARPDPAPLPRACPRCGAVAPARAPYFYRDQRSPDGLERRCAACARARPRRALSPAALIALSSRYRASAGGAATIRASKRALARRRASAASDPLRPMACPDCGSRWPLAPVPDRPTAWRCRACNGVQDRCPSGPTARAAP